MRTVPAILKAARLSNKTELETDEADNGGSKEATTQAEGEAGTEKRRSRG